MFFGLRRRHFAALALLAFGSASAAQSAGVVLFQGNPPVLELTVQGPLSQVYKQRKLQQRDDLPAKLIYAVEGSEVTVDLKVRTRGNFRRRECRQPPLRLNFDQDSEAEHLFRGQDKLKLVLPCRPNEKYEDLIVAEYLTYRLYSLLGNYAFRVHPVRVRFQETVKRNSPFKDGFAFLIEDLDQMARRYGKDVVDDERTNFQSLDAAELAIVEVFQFMIGGHDWSVIGGPKGERCCHNARLIKEPGWDVDLIPVPYDFDLTGIVDAPYAFPPEQLPIRNVRQRFFRGRCKGPALWKLTFDRFQAAKPAVYALYRDNPWLSARKLTRTLSYLDDFYAILESEKRTADTIVNRCRGSIPS